jgi:transcriptional regulator with XRE-family HTH domain
VDKPASVLIIAIKEGMRRNGWSQQELARRAGVAQPQLNRWLTGKASPTIENVMRISVAFGVRTSELFEEHRKDPPYSPDVKGIADRLVHLSPKSLKAVEAVVESFAVSGGAAPSAGLREEAPTDAAGSSEIKRKLIAAIHATPENHLKNAAPLILDALDPTPPKRLAEHESRKKAR